MRALALALALGLAGCAASPSPSTSPSPSPSPSTPTSPSPDTPDPPRPSGPSNPVVLLGDIASPANFDVKAPLTDALPKLRDCYVAALKGTPALRGKMMVRFVANETGKVTNVEEVSSTTKDAGLFECVKGVVSSLALPKPGGTATVMMPLKFKQ